VRFVWIGFEGLWQPLMGLANISVQNTKNARDELRERRWPLFNCGAHGNACFSIFACVYVNGKSDAQRTWWDLGGWSRLGWNLLKLSDTQVRSDNLWGLQVLCNGELGTMASATLVAHAEDLSVVSLFLGCWLGCWRWWRR